MSELLARDVQYADTLQQMMNKCVNMRNHGQQWACFMRLGCQSELVDYSNCLLKYQKSRFLCKIPKLGLIDCIKGQATAINLLENRYDE